MLSGPVGGLGGVSLGRRFSGGSGGSGGPGHSCVVDALPGGVVLAINVRERCRVTRSCRNHMPDHFRSAI